MHKTIYTNVMELEFEHEPNFLIQLKCYTFLNDGFHIEQKQGKEYRGGDILGKYNITAKEISNGIFRAITIFPKRKK